MTDESKNTGNEYIDEAGFMPEIDIEIDSQFIKTHSTPRQIQENTVNELDEILSDLHGYEIPLTGEVTLDADLDYQNKLIAREKAEAKRQIQELIAKDYILKSEVESALGEDEVHPIKHYSTWKISTRNKLRREIRQKLALQTKKG